jgi:hypothetical protein
MKSFETSIEIGVDGSLKLLSLLQTWIKPNRAHVLITVESVDEKPKRQKLTATPEMIAGRSAAMAKVRKIGPYCEINHPK